MFANCQRVCRVTGVGWCTRYIPHQQPPTPATVQGRRGRAALLALLLAAAAQPLQAQSAPQVEDYTKESSFGSTAQDIRPTVSGAYIQDGCDGTAGDTATLVLLLTIDVDANNRYDVQFGLSDDPVANHMVVSTCVAGGGGGLPGFDTAPSVGDLDGGGDCADMSQDETTGEIETALTFACASLLDGGAALDSTPLYPVVQWSRRTDDSAFADSPMLPGTMLPASCRVGTLFTPTAVTIGEVALEAVDVGDFLAGLGVPAMSAEKGRRCSMPGRTARRPRPHRPSPARL